MRNEASRGALSLENWREQIRRGGLDLAVLLAIAPEPRYGLEIIRHLEAETTLVVAEGTIYPILARLTRDGLVTAQWVTGEGAHPRKYYRLTPAGEEQLRERMEHWDGFVLKIGRLAKAARRSLA
jgi:PadR family transcriptional regulator PadR